MATPPRNLDTYFYNYLEMLYDVDKQEELTHKATLAVCSLARDAQDATYILEVLGLKE